MRMDEENDVLNDPESTEEDQNDGQLTDGNDDSGTDGDEEQIVYTNLENPDPDSVDEYFNGLEEEEESSELVPEQMVTQDNLEIPEEAEYGDDYVPGEDDVVYTNLNEKDDDGVESTVEEFGEDESISFDLDETVSQENLEMPDPVEYGENYIPGEDDLVYTNLESRDVDGVDEYIENGGTGDSSSVFVPEETISQEDLESPTAVEYGENYVPGEDDLVYTSLEEPDEDGTEGLIDNLGDDSSSQTQEPDGIISKLEEMEEIE